MIIDTMHGKPLTLIGVPGEDFDVGTMEQMRLAMSLPPVIRGALMPDAHLGYSLPIGGVILLENAISPAFVGVDIACRMTLSIVPELPLDIDKKWVLTCMRNSSSFGVGSATQGMSHAVMQEPLWDELPILKELKPLAQSQLGSSGGGNHFFNLMLTWHHEQLSYAFMTHSGSRGTGYKLAAHYDKLATQQHPEVPKGYAWLDLDTDEGREYLAVMQLMGKYAQANHQIIHSLVTSILGVNVEKRIENHHNYAWVEPEGVLHRKGATPAQREVLGIIPGTCGTNTYLVKGTGNEDALWSTSHGAGRAMSSSQAKKQYDPDAFRRSVADVLISGVNTNETPAAYKDIEHVMARQVEDGLCNVVTTLRPVISVMGGNYNADPN